jgi:hypothetical protein
VAYGTISSAAFDLLGSGPIGPGPLIQPVLIRG